MIVITGAAGFIGSALVWRLNQLGKNNIIIVDELGKEEKWKNLVGLDFEDFINKDLFLEKLESGLNFKVDDIIKDLDKKLKNEN